MAEHSLKVLQCEQRKIFKVCFSIFQQEHERVKCQFSFRSGYSSNHSYLYFFWKFLKVHDGYYVSSTFINLEKTFDTIDQQILVQKLYNMVLEV